MQLENTNTMPSGNSARIAEPVFVFLTALVLYLSTLANNFSASHDSISYLNGIVNGRHLFHQHHLLYHFTAHIYYLGLHKIFSFIQPHYIVESFTALFGSACVAMAYCFFRFRFRKGIIYSCIAVSVVAFSYGVWSYSTNIEVYAVSNLFVLLALYIATKTNPSVSDFRVIAILHSFAILFHQVNILLIPVVVYTMWANSKTIPWSRTFIQYALIGILITGSVYLYIGWVIEGNNSIVGFKQWIAGYTEETDYWQPFSPLNIVTGISRALIGGQFLFEWPVAQNYLQRSFPAHGLSDEQFLVRNMSAAEAWLYVIITVIIMSLIIFTIIRFVKNFKSIRLKYQRTLVPLLICLACYCIFFFFWMPQIVEFWILQTILFWIIILGTLPLIDSKTQWSSLIVGALSALVFFVNYFGSISRLTNINNDWYYLQMQKIRPSLTRNDIVVFKDGWIIKDYVAYFTKSAVVDSPIDMREKAEADEKMRQALDSGGKIFLFEETNRTDIIRKADYFDSLLSQYSQKARVLSREPLIWVIQ